jgi:nucleoid-associated protein YgaU
MNIQTINKVVVASASIVSLAFIPSCASMDPQYAAYKQQQQAQAAAAANPYGVPGAADTGTNPYAVPGADGETGAPYQEIPGVSNIPSVQEYTPPPAPTQPYTPLPAEPSGAASTHTVVKGDTIWGLTRKYGVTGDQIREANNLTTDTIWIGQRLVIPGR